MPAPPLATSVANAAPNADAAKSAPDSDPETSAVVSGDRRYLPLLRAIAAILILYTCSLAQAIIVPVLLAVLVGLMLAPAVRLLERLRVPRWLGALAALAFVIALVGGVLIALASPARAWMSRMPQAMAHMESSMHSLQRPLQAASDAVKDIGKLAQFDNAQSVRVVEASPGMLSQFLSAAPSALAGILITVILIFVFLLHGDDLLRKFVTLAPHLRAKRDLVASIRRAQHDLSIYMITITLINGALGLATAGALAAMHVADPLLWGGIAALLNYAPYIGPMLTAVALSIVGFAEFASPLSALALPATFLGLHLVEGQLVTPHLLGRQLALDPVMVFLTLILLGWIWGVAGLLLAVPIMACAKIIAERTPGGNVVATVLSQSTRATENARATQDEPAVVTASDLHFEGNANG